jgi:hypothetical protein
MAFDMSASLNSRVDRLRSDYTRITGNAFVYFFCPVLHRDEEAQLCKGHIVPQGFARSSRAWTVQRKDVDNFYGTSFEDDFSAIQYRTEGQTPGEVLTDRKLSRRFRPTILFEGEPVDYFVADRGVPEHFARLEYHSRGASVDLALKIPRERAAGLIDGNWEIEIAKDVRIPALVSLIKAAHLTLFDMLGYRYALSAGGQFVGRQILGDFFRQNHGKARSEIRSNAFVFFREFAHMVRPVKSGLALEGTVTDKTVFICRGSGALVWAFMVFIKTSDVLHAVLIPVLEESDAAAMFSRFLQDQNDTIEVSCCRFQRGQWETSREVATLTWPKAGVLYP